MSKFKVGDRVLCVRGNEDPRGCQKGVEYTVIGVRGCKKCNNTELNIGFKAPPLAKAHCPFCGDFDLWPVDWWFDASRFVKADEQDNYASEVLEEIAEQIEVEFIELHNK